MKELFLSPAAKDMIRGLLFWETPVDGMLLGHRRGRIFQIEDILSLPGGGLSQESIAALGDSFMERLIGFFTTGGEEEEREKACLNPFGFGKLFVRFSRTKGKDFRLSPYTIEYGDGFFLSAISPGIEDGK